MLFTKDNHKNLARMTYVQKYVKGVHSRHYISFDRLDLDRILV